MFKISNITRLEIGSISKFSGSYWLEAKISWPGLGSGSKKISLAWLGSRKNRLDPALSLVSVVVSYYICVK